MFVIHQVVGVLSNPLFASLIALAVGLLFVRRRSAKERVRLFMGEDQR